MKKFMCAFVAMIALASMVLAQTVARNVTVPAKISGAQAPYIVYNTPLAGETSSASAVTILTTPATGTYRIGFAGSLTVVGASCAATSTATANLIYQDPIAASGQTVVLSTFTTSGTNGTLGTVAQTGVTNFVFRSLVGKAIQVSSTYTGGSMCSPGPTIVITPVLEAVGQ